jgi:AcrR family transcriptional regulator
VCPDRGRRREAERNDARLLRAARDAFAELGWKASVSDIARRADVGMGTIYRRYACKEELAQHMRLTAVNHLADDAVAAADETPDGWGALVRFMTRALSTQAGSLLPLIGGRLPVTDAIEDATVRLHTAVESLVQRAQRERALRADVVSADVLLLLAHLEILFPTTAARSRQLRLRYLDVVLDGLAHRAPHIPHPPRDLTGPAPVWQELGGLWHADPPDATGTDPDATGTNREGTGSP